MFCSFCFAAPPGPAPAPNLFAAPYMIEVNTIRLRNVNGSLATLSETGGFRKLIRQRAQAIGITGTIQRYVLDDIIVVA